MKIAKRPVLGSLKYDLIDSFMWTGLFLAQLLVIIWNNPAGWELKQLEYVLSFINELSERASESPKAFLIMLLLIPVIAAKLIWDNISNKTNLTFWHHELIVVCGCSYTILLTSIGQGPCNQLDTFMVIVWLAIASKHKTLIAYHVTKKEGNMNEK